MADRNALERPLRRVGAYQWGVDEVLGEEPRLQLAGPDHVGNQQVVGTVIAAFLDQRGEPVRLAEDDLVRLQQAGQHRRYLLDTVGRPWDPGDLGDVAGVADRDTTQGLDALGD